MESILRIERLDITNFRGIRSISMTDLGHIIIIAGQNGSGKSCIFDAIRLLKSVYGGYQANEWQQWMGEFQIVLSNRASDYKTILNDANKELKISCEFKLAEDERAFISANIHELLKEYVWRLELPEAYSWGGYKMALFAAQFRDREAAVGQRAFALYPEFLREITAPTIRGEVTIPTGGVPQITQSIALALIFSTFRPNEIGVLDYHGAQRHYGRESVQGINLNLYANEQQRSQTAL
ncbi:AAA family ATPase [Methylobacterium sp. WL18]|uniref:AAA family ATPase n=1 Tax=Methylobacterium sp. WL18 TaxID=2603897 RepID=UPI0032B19131